MEEEKESSNKGKLIAVLIVGAMIIGFSALFLMFSEEVKQADIQRKDLLLGVNENGYFCKVVNENIFVDPIECFKQKCLEMQERDPFSTNATTCLRELGIIP